jgi:hypothetical protein
MIAFLWHDEPLRKYFLSLQVDKIIFCVYDIDNWACYQEFMPEIFPPSSAKDTSEGTKILVTIFNPRPLKLPIRLSKCLELKLLIGNNKKKNNRGPFN